MHLFGYPKLRPDLSLKCWRLRPTDYAVSSLTSLEELAESCDLLLLLLLAQMIRESRHLIALRLHHHLLPASIDSRFSPACAASYACRLI